MDQQMKKIQEDFSTRIASKELEHEEKVKRLVKKYETEKVRIEEVHQSQISSLSERFESSEKVVREQHHVEVLQLQKDMLSVEKKMEDTVEKYERELHSREGEMSEQVDKATFRALTAEKKLQDTGMEQTIFQLQAQVTELSKSLAHTQQREREISNYLQEAKTRMSMNSHLADPERVKYLRQVLFEYMMGSEGKTMAKVLVVLMQYPAEEAQKILEKHKLPPKG
uniref:GRIP domain-containing protein n=1 Tax=Ciona savignyi TaxID=51511 RepID=H2YYI0_CIOSA